MLFKSQVKYIQSLDQKKHRDADNVFIAEGPKIIRELLQTNASNIKQLYALREWIDANKELTGVTEVIEITPSELERISLLSTPHQVLAIVEQFSNDDFPATGGTITLALDAIQDPGNLGTIIRTADWFGVEQLVCGKECADIYNPKVVQSTMGSIARVKVLYTDLDQWLPEQKEVPVFAAVLNGKDVREIQSLQEGIIIIGNESKGIAPAILQYATTRISITGKGRSESLNAAVAAGIILSHVC